MVMASFSIVKFRKEKETLVRSQCGQSANAVLKLVLGSDLVVWQAEFGIGRFQSDGNRHTDVCSEGNITKLAAFPDALHEQP